MNELTAINGDGLAIRHSFGGAVGDWAARAQRAAVMLDARWRTLATEPEEGAATAEYAVVLVAATGFAAILVALLKSDTIKTLLTNIVKKALSVAAKPVAATAEYAVARQLVVLDGDVAAARASAGAGVHVAVAGEANRYVVTTTCRVVSDPLHVIPGSVRGNAVGVKQDGQA